MVDEDGSGTLTFDEFLEFMLNENRQKMFVKVMKDERLNQLQKAVDYDNINENKGPKQIDMEYFPLAAD